ncbi:agmatine deiminase family protein [Magnetococcus sp. PR-3]|uniref:agmatine deiminase family protein n=1 Tax=Magnetococcus sp. PR-3 TaxID=3120355 RepID=UPI002FCDF701
MMARRTFLQTLLVGFGLANSALAGTPKGFYAPAEDAPHARTWMCWPMLPEDAEGSDLAYVEEVQLTLARLAQTIAQYEPVTLCADRAEHALIRELCGPDVQLVHIPTDDMWARDSGPVFVRNPAGVKAAVDFNFNGWGGKQPVPSDKHVAGAIADHLGCHYFKANIVGEGGGLEYDGDGTLILTESCWVNPNRNPRHSRQEIERELKKLLGVQKVIWIPGLAGEDITDGHVDGLLRFVRPGVVMTSLFPHDDSEQSLADAEAVEILQRATDARGRALQMVEIPAAEDPANSSEELFTGYANYYVGNGALFTPRFGDKFADRYAKRTLGKLFPDRKIVMLDVDRIYENGGGIHCVTQQEPV